MIRLLSILILGISLSACQAQSNAEGIDTEGLKSKAQEENVFVVDVRTQAEVNAGYIAEADYFINVQASDFADQIAGLDKDATYIVYCRSGVRSTSALNYMEQQGFTKLYELKGGILNYNDPNTIVTK
jgi:rhodanese-related sulfurtransferase